MTASQGGGAVAQNILNSLVNPTQNQKVMMSLDATSNDAGTNRTKLKRSVRVYK